MKPIVDCGKPFWQLDTISHWPTYFYDFIESNVVRSYLSFDTEPLHTFGGGHLQIHVISHFKVSGCGSVVMVTLLSDLSHLQILSYHLYLFSASLTKSGLKSVLSPASDQFSGVRHLRP
jgi:hypothetical protein